MDREGLRVWLDAYVEAWRGYDRSRIEALFTDDARYGYHPDDEPIVGAEAIADSWLSDRDEPGSWEASYEPFAADDDRAVAVGVSTYLDHDGSVRAVYDNCFLLRFDREGRCAEFTEVFFERPADGR